MNRWCSVCGNLAAAMPCHAVPDQNRPYEVVLPHPTCIHTQRQVLPPIYLSALRDTRSVVYVQISRIDDRLQP